ncbi:carboxy-S-adenosyl-L-methionine synthase CmoA [Aliidiomarina halalkaliphila]|uniref:Carboxy-S-adenosyl-L-methionine synthase n=1 Tax=Aliidiomarina halalkaliphila TaxID=2593535 RepID=A0A552X5L5_9GAMM|nr:carboxy-S-adenosyl-L-methionine synthase CmoA [Aliidiomarina halalkaliphila]TRW50266.1 carboxy-S-adenosyl-L-methionine synthase CmoA [Aliidiomarina halalkaliphila]
MTKQRDSIYATPLTQVSDFAFDAQVASVFPDMINRSVPGYATIVNTIGRLANRYAQENTRIYDLGCSLGAVSLSIKQQCTVPGVHITAIDNSNAMVERCQSHVNAYRGAIPIDVQVADILDYRFEPCSIIVLNFTLQFIEQEQRTSVIQKLYNALLPGGLLVLSEKVTHEDPVADALLIDLHHEFKRENGYSDLEISQKRAALENVMRIDTPERHEARLRETGFTTVQAWFRCFNFTSWIAIKGNANEHA